MIRLHIVKKLAHRRSLIEKLHLSHFCHGNVKLVSSVRDHPDFCKLKLRYICVQAVTVDEDFEINKAADYLRRFLSYISWNSS